MASGHFVFGDVPATISIDPQDVIWFGNQLQANGVNVRRGISRSIAAARDLAAIAYAMTLMVKRLPGAVRLQTKVPDSFDIAPAAAMISAIHGLRRAHSVNGDLLDDAWKILAESAPTSTPQERTNERDHMWEIVNATVYSWFGERVKLNLADAGVDVGGRFGAVDWGIECKVLYSEKSQRRVDRIIDGVKQIEADQSIAKGVVAVSVTDCLDHTPFKNSFTNAGTAFPTLANVTALLAARVKQCAMETTTKSLQRRLARDRNGRARQKCRAVIYVGQTVAVAGGQVNVFTAQFTALRSPAEDPDRTFAVRYHDGWIQLQDPPAADDRSEGRP